jgi:Spy/CpxP family protein refolding chaperone
MKKNSLASFVKIIRNEIQMISELTPNQKQKLDNNLSQILEILNRTATKTHTKSSELVRSGNSKNSTRNDSREQITPDQIEKKTRGLMKPLSQYKRKVDDIVKANKKASQKIKEDVEEELLKFYSDQARSVNNSASVSDNQNRESIASQ